MKEPLGDLTNPKYVIDLFEQATDINLEAENRSGSMLELGDQGRVLLSGDLHDSKENLRKILSLAELDASPDHHVIFQEVIHGHSLMNGMDFSYRTLANIAHLQIQYPKQVHMLLGNHELSQVNGDMVMKDGINCVEAFDMGMEFVFYDSTQEVYLALDNYIRSMLIAIKAKNGLFFSHSLPPDRLRSRFDMAILDRRWNDGDAIPDGAAFLMVWGRSFKEDWVDILANHWGVEQFLIGHMPVEFGYDTFGPKVLAMNSDSAHGVVMMLDLAKKYSQDGLMDEIMPLAGVV